MTSTERKPHILIIRLSSMGETAMIVPVVRALRDTHPNLRITILTHPKFRPFFRDITGIGFLDADLRGRHRNLGGIIRLWRDLQSLDVTHVADLHDVPRTKMLRRLLRLSGQKVAVIRDNRTENRELTRKFRKEKKQLEHMVERYRDTIVRAGFDIPQPACVADAPHPVIPAEIADTAGGKHGKWIGVAPFARYKGAIYPPNLMCELVGILAERYERVFIFGGGPYEQEFAEYLSKAFDGVFSVIGRVKLDAELDLISNLDALVSMDSPTLHMASITGTPVVSIWGATHPFAGFYGFGQPDANAVHLDLPCRPCSVHGNKPCIYRDYHCLTRITPQSVADKVAETVEIAEVADKVAETVEAGNTVPEVPAAI